MNWRLFLYVLVCLGYSCQKRAHYSPIAQDHRPPIRFTALPQQPEVPQDNLQTEDKIALGKLLFFDPILSGNKDVACATCHHPDHGYAEFRDLSIGVNGIGLASKRKFKTPNDDIDIVKRNAHTVLNTAYNGIDDRFRAISPKIAPMFWDNRVTSLEAQALEPIKSLEEMRGHNISAASILDSIVIRLKNTPEYKELFKKAFPKEPTISKTTLGKAIASFERSLVTPNSRFDRFLNGDKTAISISEKEGFETFKRVGCAECHRGPMLSDYKLHTLGVEENKKLSFVDSANGHFKFRTPTLRNLRFTAPYMHNGTLPNFQKVLEFYEDVSRGMSKNPDILPHQIDPLIRRMRLKEHDFKPIMTFLNCLSSEDFDKKIPQQVPSGLPVGGNI